ncbi:MAG: hypothetical protein WCY30_00040 [Candidatus Neomarinimicrobiota bacterium]|jgi:hypothetical protein
MNIERVLKRYDGSRRKAVLVVLWNDTANTKTSVTTTDKNGRFRFENVELRFETGTYHLEYYGDGILPTIWDQAQVEKIQEDPVTPWEYEIPIFNMAVEFDTIPPDNTIGTVGMEA